MASIKVSELPAVTAISANDVLIINDENATTSSITITFFTSSFTGQDLTFTGNATFSAPTTFAQASVPVFNSNTTFNQGATFLGPVTLGPLTNIPLSSLSDVTYTQPVTNGYALAWDSTASTWEPQQVGHIDSVVGDLTPQLGGNLDTNGFSITSSQTGASGSFGSDIYIVPAQGGKTIIQGSSANGSGSLGLTDPTTAYKTSIIAHNNLAADYAFVLPASMGVDGQVLKTDGTQQTSWVTITPAMINAATAAQGTAADNAMAKGINNNLVAASDDTAAAAAGVVVGGIYQTNGTVKVRLS